MSYVRHQTLGIQTYPWHIKMNIQNYTYRNNNIIISTVDNKTDYNYHLKHIKVSHTCVDFYTAIKNHRNINYNICPVTYFYTSFKTDNNISWRAFSKYLYVIWPAIVTTVSFRFICSINCSSTYVQGYVLNNHFSFLYL